jgi:hypothetical protein
MMRYTYNGSDERVFPTLGITVKKGDVFDAPEGFSHPDCSSGEAKSFTKTSTTTTPSAASDKTLGE